VLEVKWMLQKIRVFASLAEAESTWRSFEERALLHGFQRFEWIRAWHEEVGGETSPYVVEVSNGDGQTLSLLPLGIRSDGGTRVLTWLGGAVSDYHGGLLAPTTSSDVRPTDETARLPFEVLPPFDVIHFEKQPLLIGREHNPFLARSARPHLQAMATTVRDGGPWPASAAARKDLRRRRRRLEERGPVQFVVASDVPMAEEIATVMMEQKSRQYRATGVWDVFANPAYRSFYMRMTREGVRSGLVHVSALTCGGNIIATEWSLIHRERCYGLLPSYDLGWAAFSPGSLILQEALAWCGERGIDTYDFTIGDEEYKEQWCDQVMGTFETLTPQSLGGRFYTTPRIVTRTVKNTLRKHPRLLSIARQLQ